MIKNEEEEKIDRVRRILLNKVYSYKTFTLTLTLTLKLLSSLIHILK